MRFASLRIAARSLVKQPVFTTVVTVSLALGIALNTTMYGMLDALIRPNIEMRDPGRLYWIRFYGDYHWRVDNRERDVAVSTGMHTYESITRTDIEQGAKPFEHGETATEASVARVGANYFDVLGVHLIAGRAFIPSDEAADITPMVITDGLANRLFPNGEQAVGAHILVGRKPRIVIGVIPDKAHFPDERYGAWEIAPFNPRTMYFRLIRLRPGATARDADRELAVIAQRIALQSGEDPKSVAFRFHRAADPDFQFKNVHYALIGSVLAVLLVACANLANIQLARGLGRRRELAVRSALGATRKRLILHLLNETALLAVCGLALGLVLTFWSAHLLKASIPTSVADYVVEPQVSWRVLVFALGVTTFCLVAVGLLPSITVSRTDPNDLLKSGAGTGATKDIRRRYALLVGVEIALALALTSLGTVTLRTSLTAGVSGDGFDSRPLAMGFLGPKRKPGQTLYYAALLDLVAARLRANPHVAEATATAPLPIEGDSLTMDNAGGVSGYPTPMSTITVTTASYARTHRMPIVRGRDFLDGQSEHGEVIVDERTARLLWPGANPVGALIKFGSRKSNRPYVRVVGVLGEQPQFAAKSDDAAILRNRRALGTVLYLPARGDSISVAEGVPLVNFIARTSEAPRALPVALRRELDSWSDFSSYGVASMDDFLGLTRTRESTQFIAKLFLIFAGLGLGLAAFGVYGVVAHAVAERRRELGVRVALGASAKDILHTVLRESVPVALAGAALGLLLTKYGVVLLQNVAGGDIYNAPLFAVIAVAVVAVAAFAALGPAWRATRINPAESLRSE